jgi:hypothetical protein
MNKNTNILIKIKKIKRQINDNKKRIKEIIYNKNYEKKRFKNL